MSNINESIFQDFCKVSQDVLKLKEKVEKKPVNPQARKMLHKDLETIQDTIERLRGSAEQTQTRALAQFEAIEAQVISLYREIEERFESYEISLISKGALELGASLENGKMFKIAKKINRLQHNIQFLFEHRRPSLQNRKIVQLAIKLMDYAHDALSTKGETSKEQIKLIHLLNMLLQEAMTRIGMADDPREQEVAIELYEIIDMLYRKEINEAMLKLNQLRSQLSRAQKRRIDAAGSDELISVLLEIADGDPCLEWEISPTKIHALFA